jgi:phenylacetic acid degradation operon negative regulatory protein
VDLATRAFDTAAIGARYQDFLARWQSPSSALPDDLARQLLLHADWLDLVRQDPHLPAELLADDWPAIEAEQLFQTLATRYVETATPLAEAAIESISV